MVDKFRVFDLHEEGKVRKEYIIKNKREDSCTEIISEKYMKYCEDVVKNHIHYCFSNEDLGFSFQCFLYGK